MSEAKQPAVTLYDSAVPPLTAGEYTVQVKQKVKYWDWEKTDGQLKKLQKESPFDKSFKFQVSGPRFSLSPAEIYERYPAADAKGAFSETFPHIVLSRRTLPWERRLKGDDPKRPRPWLALLLLNEHEIGPDPEGEQRLNNAPAKDLHTAGADVLVPDGEKIDEWEKEEHCLTLDLSVQHFQAIAPSWNDLPYLAHVRKVDTTDHMEAAGIDDEGWFSVVICNRLPTPGLEHRAFLISLENLNDYLPPSKIDPKYKTVRLVVLAHWRFVDDAKRSAQQLLTNLHCSALRLPEDDKPVDQDEKIEKTLRFGYVPLLHTTADGYRTVSWYRGPFAPYFLPTKPKDKVYPSADAALRYDPEHGLFDVSYSAAWQLGRILGLQNQPFARAIRQLKLRELQEDAKRNNLEKLEKHFGTTRDSKTWQELFGKEATAPSIPSTAGIPLEIRQWLGRLFKLHGVPFDYLVPHPDLLKPERLRFFFLDTTWIGALMDGALSVGRTRYSDIFLEQAKAGNFLRDVASDEIKSGTQTYAGEDKELKDEKILGHITGFLLRSDLVASWRGVEIKAEDSSKTTLGVLRMERLKNDTLLAVYNGQIAKIIITQPPQGLHFGKPAPPQGQWRDQKGTVLQFHVADGQPTEPNPAQFASKLFVKRLQRTINLVFGR